MLEKKLQEKIKNSISIEEDENNFTFTMLNKDQYEEEEEEIEDDEQIEKELNEHKNESKPNDNTNNIKLDSTNQINNQGSKSLNCNIKENDDLSNVEVIASSDINNNFNTSNIVQDIHIDRLAFYKYKYKFNDEDLKEFSNENYFYDVSSKNCHFHTIFQRGSLVDITQLSSIIACYKLRQSNSSKIIQMFTNSKKDEYFVPYFIFFDEFFIYFIKNNELDFISQGDDRRAFTRTIGKSYNIKQLEKIKVAEYNNKKLKVTFTFKLHSVFEEFIDEKYIIKDIYLDLSDGEVFFKMLRFYLKIYKIPIIV